MLIIIAAMIASILSILLVKPFDKGGGKDDTAPETIQQLEPN